jgi:hypothetical protein
MLLWPINTFLGNDASKQFARNNRDIEVSLETVFSTVVRPEELQGGQLGQE